MSRLGRTSSARLCLWDWVNRSASRLSAAMLIAVGLGTACGDEQPPDHLEKSSLGKISQASHAPGCPAPSSSSVCTLTPTADTTVYLAHANDYGQAKEMCVG